jgi:hypothetical protein
MKENETVSMKTLLWIAGSIVAALVLATPLVLGIIHIANDHTLLHTMDRVVANHENILRQALGQKPEPQPQPVPAPEPEKKAK